MNDKRDPGHKLIEAQLDGLAEIELNILYAGQGRLHLLYHLIAAPRGGPLAEGLHDNHDVGILNGHRVGRHLRRTDLGHHVLDLREFIL